MKAPVKFVKVGTGTSEDFFKRAITRAKKMDRGERVAPEMRITFEDPAEFVRAMTAKRVEIILTIRKQSAAISEIAKILHRDRAAVDRDVKVLESLGLVTTKMETNPGHGRRKIVAPLAEKYELVATI
jgi:predicted transcriptional regulator